MKTVCQLPQTVFRRASIRLPSRRDSASPTACLRALFATLLLAAVLAGPSGCVTQRQVADIVSQSNASLLAAQVGADGQVDANPGAANPGADVASKKIDAFIASHPEQKTAASALRIRQAVLFLGQGNYNLAEAAFNAASLNDLKTDRDRALKELQLHLVWWYRTSRSAQGRVLTGLESDEADRAMAAFAEQVQKRKDSPEIRDLLAEMRAWIGLKLAEAAPDRANLKRRLEAAIQGYAGIFSAEDLPALDRPESELQEKAIGVEARRQLRAKAVLAKARELAATLDGVNRPDFKNATFQRLISP
jgi:hypothetical protein